jgi:hypothetical protein
MDGTRIAWIKPKDGTRIPRIKPGGARDAIPRITRETTGSEKELVYAIGVPYERLHR